MAYELQELIPFENELFYRPNDDKSSNCGFIGYLRIDFGRSGQEFYTTWFDGQPHLNTPNFKDCFNLLVNGLRSEMFEDRVNMRLWCNGIYGIDLGNRGTGFKLHSADYTYYLRCKPGEHDYDAYLFVYDDRYLLPELARQKQERTIINALPVKAKEEKDYER
jgi:hypothetical protein